LFFFFLLKRDPKLVKGTGQVRILGFFSCEGIGEYFCREKCVGAKGRVGYLGKDNHR